jgi:hypothetical protein
MEVSLSAANDANDEINIGDMLIRTLRKAYGSKFAEGCHDDEKLRDALSKMDESSRSTLIHDHQQGKVGQICREAGLDRRGPRINYGPPGKLHEASCSEPRVRGSPSRARRGLCAGVSTGAL